MYLTKIVYTTLVLSKCSFGQQNDDETIIISETGDVTLRFFPERKFINTAKSMGTKGRSVFTQKRLEIDGSYQNYLTNKNNKLQGFLMGYENPVYTPKFERILREYK